MSSSKYAYAYGVVSGKTGKLFDSRTFDELVMARSVEEVAAFLEGTDYEPDLREAVGKKINVDLMERSLVNHFRRVYEEIISSLPAFDRDMFDRMIMGKFRTDNLKIIMRSIHSGKSKEEIGEALYPAFDHDTTKKLLESENMRQFVSRLENIQGQDVLEEKLDEYEKTNDLLPLEIAIDKEFLESWNKKFSDEFNSVINHVLFVLIGRRRLSFPEELQYFVGLRTDVTNIKTLLTCKLSDTDCSDYMIKGGLYLASGIEEMKHKEIGDILDMLDETPYGPACRESFELYQKSKSISGLDTRLEEKFLSILKERSLFDALSIMPITLFISQKWREVRNLRAILVCKHHKIQPAEIKGIMVQ